MEMERRIISRPGFPGVRFPFFLFVLCAKIFKPVRQRGSVFFGFLAAQAPHDSPKRRRRPVGLANVVDIGIIESLSVYAP